MGFPRISDMVIATRNQEAVQQGLWPTAGGFYLW